MIRLETYQSGHFETAYGYQYFVPSAVNAEWVWDSPVVNGLLEKAAVKLGELNSFSRLVPSIDLFLQMHVTKEAVISSRIEGTQTNIDEALLPESEIASERKNDWREVNNYINALNNAIEALEALPISTRLLRQTHSILMTSVRGEQKLPGEFRSSQNWIGGNTLNDAVFIPPHHQYVDGLMGDLENFLHNDQIKTPALIRVAIAHYQFETIHPFLDGNGRIGRLLIPLYLVSEKILDKPLLYLSRYFERNKSLYYDNLTRVRTHNDMAQWVKYFLAGVEETADIAVRTLTKVLQLKADAEKDIHARLGRRAHLGLALLQHLFRRPMLSIGEAAQLSNISFKSAANLVKDLEEMGLLEEFTSQSRNRIFGFRPYLSVFEEHL